MNPVTLISGFVPLVLFSLLDGPVSPGDAAVIGAAAAVIVAAATIRHGLPALPIVQAITLAIFAVVAYSASPATQSWLTGYGRGIPSLVLAAYMLSTVPFWPFTAIFARAEVPREAWTSPRFLALNRRISAAWGAAILILGLCRIATAAISTSSLPRFQAHLIEWGPAVIAIILAFRYTKRTIAEAHEGSAPESQPARNY